MPLFVMVAEYTRSPESITRLNRFLDKTDPRLRMPDQPDTPGRDG